MTHCEKQQQFASPLLGYVAPGHHTAGKSLLFIVSDLPNVVCPSRHYFV